MAILGSTAKPTTAQEWWGLNVKNQYAILFEMPAGGPWKITKVGVWAAGKDATPSAKVCLWTPTAGVLIHESAAFNMTSRSFGLGEADLYEKTLTTAKVISGGNTILAGFVRDPSEAAQFPTRNSIVGGTVNNNHVDHYDSTEPGTIDPGSTHAQQMGVYLVYELDNSAPNAPTIDEPDQNEIVFDQTPLIDWTFSDPDAGDTQSAYEVEVDNSSGFGSPAWDSGKVTSSATSASVGATLTRGTTYYVRVRTWDADGLVSAWSSTRTFKIAATPTTSVTSPSAGGVAAPLYYTAGSDTNPKFKIGWSFSCPDGGTQTSAIIRIKDSAGSSTLYTHNASGTSTTANVSGYQPANGTIYSVSSQVTCSHGVQSTETTATARNMRARWGRGAYRADLTTAPLTLSSSVSSSSNSGSVIAEYGSNSTTTEPTDWKATIAEVTKQRYIWHRVTLLPQAVAAPTSPALNSITLTYSNNVLASDNWALDTDSSIDGGTYVYGTQSLKQVCSATVRQTVQDVPVLPNTDYVLSGRIKTQGDPVASIRLRDTATSAVLVIAAAPADTDWTRYSVAWNSGGADTVTVSCATSNSGVSGSVAWFDALKLEASTVVTPWTPGFLGTAVVLDAGGLQIDGEKGGVFRLKSPVGYLVDLADGGLRLSGDGTLGDASLTSTAHAFQIGATTATNLIMDNNEVMARNNGAISTLYLNVDGGGITIGPGSEITRSGESWVAVTFTNSWVNYGGAFETVGYRKDALGFVHLRGLMKSGTMNVGAFTLPAGFRPGGTEIFACVSSPGDAFRLDITSAGVVTPGTGSNSYYSLAGITFRAEN